MKILQKLFKEKSCSKCMEYSISSYRHLVQKTDLCGPTCLQMVLFRKGHWFDQEELAAKMRTKILFNAQHMYIHDLEAVDETHPERGMDSKNFTTEDMLGFLQDLDIEPQLYYPVTVDELRMLIVDALYNDQDVIANIKLTAFLPDRTTGHYVLIQGFDEERDKVVLLDPDFRNKKQWSCSLEELKVAMDETWDGKERGLVIMRDI